jgi:hypothetical protein
MEQEGSLMATNLSPAAICRQLELNAASNPIPIRPSPAMVRDAEIEAAEAAHALTKADQECARYDVLRSKAAEARDRALRFRELVAGIPPVVALLALPGIF